MKTSSYYNITACAVFIGALIPIGAYAYNDGDFQVWNTDVEEMNIGKDLKAGFEQEFRWGDNAHEFFYQHYDAGIFYNLNKYWNVGGGYRHVLSKSQGKFKTENEPYAAATIFWDLAGFNFDDRSRLEYQHFDYQEDNFRYRNKFTARFPWKFTGMEIRPFLSDEIFIRFDSGINLNQNRFFAGLGMNLTKKIKAEVYYMLQNTKGAGIWTDANVLGTKLKVAF